MNDGPAGRISDDCVVRADAAAAAANAAIVKMEVVRHVRPAFTASDDSRTGFPAL